MRILKKISKGVLFTVLFLVFLITVSYVMFRSRPFQNWAAQKAVNFLSGELKTKVSLRSIDLELLNTLVLEGLYMEDQDGDTLGYFGKLKVNFDYRMLFDNQLQLARIRQVGMENAKLCLLLHPGREDFNYQFLIDYFSPPRKSTGKFVPFKLYINDLQLKNVDFRYRIMDKAPAAGRRFDEGYMEYRGINASLTPFKLIGDSLSFDLHKLSFTERSGFRVNELSARTIISSTVMEFDELTLKTPYSKIGNYLKYTYGNYQKLSDFVDSVKWKVSLTKSVVGMKDLAYFSDNLRPYTFPITLKGDAKGTLAHLQGKRMEIKVAQLNTLKGDIRLDDLTNTDLLHYDLKIQEMYANPSSLQDITGSKFPVELLRMGTIKYSGELRGSLTDITTDGLFETTLGKVRTDLNLRLPEGEPERYAGKIEAFQFDLGKLFNTSELGHITLSTEIDGEGFNIRDLNTSMTGTVYSLESNGYTYQNISLDGLFEKKKFNGKLDIRDPNLNLALDGQFDLNQELPTGDFNAVIGAVNLKTLGYGDINIKQVTGLKIQFEGNNIDEILLDATLNNVVLEKSDITYYLGDMTLKSFGPEKNRVVAIHSELGNVNLAGRFKMSHLSAISENVMYDLFPDYFSHLNRKREPVDVRFDVDIEDSKLITGLFLPDFTFRQFNATGIYNSSSQTMDLLARADYFKYLDYKWTDVKLESLKNQEERLSLNTTAGGFYLNDSLITDKLSLSANIGGNDINFRLNAADTTHDFSIQSGGNIALYKEAIDFTLSQTVVYIYSKPWAISDHNHLRYANSNLTIDSFNISNGRQSIAINGMTGEKTFEDLNLKITEFELKEVNPILRKWGVQLEGVTSGEVTLNGTNQGPVIESGIRIDNLGYNGDSIGDVTLNSVSQEGLYKMAINGNIKNGLINDLILQGYLDLTPGSDKIDLSLLLNESSIKPFEAFTTGLFSRVEGIANARVKVKGALKDPEITGDINVSRASLYMDYLGLPLKIEKAEITLDEKKINLGTFQVADKFGSKALAGGKIYHKNFSDLRFDIFMKDLKNFNCMELAEGQNELFSGIAFVDGNVTVKGPVDQIYLNINAKTRARTELSLPLSGTSENKGPDFIQIVDLRADNTKIREEKIGGIAMDFNFDVTENAEIKLIFDAKFNDVIRATGNGNIKMELNTFGDFYMYGKYTIATGSYNFTALNNLINKNLKVKQGGTIVWKGNPLDAAVNLVATTTVRADPSVVLPASTAPAGSSSKIGVDCEVYMRDNLFAPQIKLGIDLSKDNQSTLFANTDLVSAINQIKADQDETNKQFINLLVFNSFAPLNSGNNTASAANLGSTFQNSIGDFVSSQLNNWLSQIDPNWDVNIDYKAAGSNTDANQQIMVSLKRKLYNDRIEIGGSYGQAGNTSYDVNVSYKITKDGRLLVRAFNKKANDPRSINTSTINTSGLGLYYRREIDYFFPKWRKKMYNKHHQ